MSAEPAVGGILAELRSLLEAEGGPLAEALAEEGTEVFAPLVAGGRRTSTDPRGYALVVESILEGYLLHYGRGRIVDDPDPDLRLLAGDHLYAFGLVRLASIGDLEAVDELADLISLCAQVHATAGLDGGGVAPVPHRRPVGERGPRSCRWFMAGAARGEAPSPRGRTGGNRESAGCRKGSST